ncbi:iron uptake protein [Aquabacterium fontiphilum]|jgi:hypothetical protein|uniref:iron uptake protein n=1 Tax=Aquabacterium fontiphilum TaxID=450365 RepID=UPI0013775103|nr:iron uptake protein [Aquabacterium fontiphilum]NBD21254.1 iron uptake protein [Aquabacterium fontiphilum]
MSFHSAASVSLRVAAAVLGGYAFTWGFSGFAIAAMVAMGLSFHDAEAGALIVAWLVFLGVFLWSFAAASLARVGLVLLGGGLLMAGAATGLQAMLLN